MPILGDMIEEQSQWESWKADWVISHLAYLPISYEERESIRSEFEHQIDSERLNQLYDWVNRNIPEPIENGLSYGQGDILRKLREIDKDNRK